MVVAIISSARGARAAIDVERRGIEVGIGAGTSTLDATDLASSNGNLIEMRELVSINFSEA